LADSNAEGGYERFFGVAKRSLMGQAFLLTGDIDDPQGWARRVLQNLVTDRWRREHGRRRARLATSVVSPAPEVGHLDVVEALQRLSRDQRRALVLHDVVGLSVVEVAADLKVPEGTVRSWLSRGRTALAADLGINPTRTAETPE